MPGAQALAEKLGIHHTTASEALQLLEKQGLIESRGAGRPRAILSDPDIAPPSMRFGILLYESTDRLDPVMLDLQHHLQSAGHSAGPAPKTLQDLGMDVKRVARFVKDYDVDAWIVVAAQSDVLEWFASQPKPAFALFGRRRGVSIPSAGPDKLRAMIQSVDRLVELGHRKIVLMMREEHRKPQPAFVAQELLNTMESYGLPTGPYNLPDWKSDPDDLGRCIDSLFRLTPPSALIIDESFLFGVIQQHLAQLGIVAPRDISLVCCDPSPAFKWFRPSIAHVSWDSHKVVNHVARWADNVARGREDFRDCRIQAKFIDGGTIGPPAKCAGGM